MAWLAMTVGVRYSRNPFQLLVVAVPQVLYEVLLQQFFDIP